jgi:hypothetical protein
VAFQYSEEQQTLQETFRKSLEALCSSVFIREMRTAPSNAQAVASLFSDLGFADYLQDESCSVVDLILVAKECGRTLCPMGPFYAAYATATTRRLLGISLVDGAFVDIAAHLRGAPHFLRSQQVAAAFIIGEEGLLAPQFHVAYSTVEALREHSSIDITEPSYTAISKEQRALSATDAQKLQHELCILSTAELTGIGEKILEVTNDYVKVRKQYGKPIASFQAVQHQLAEVLMKLESAWALCEVAAEQVKDGSSGASFAARASLAYAARHVPDMIEICLQLHGGIGFTWEYDLHLFLRRALKLQALAGLSESALIALCENTSSG